MSPRVIEVVSRGRRGSDGASGVVNVLRLDENTTLSSANRGFAVIADAAITITLPSAPAVGEGWSAIIDAVGGAVTITAPSDINGSASDLVLTQGYSVQIYTDGVEYLTQFFVSNEIAAVTSDGVSNESDVPGATLTVALDHLDGLIKDPAPAAEVGQTNFNLYQSPITLTVGGTWTNGPDGETDYTGLLRVYERTGTLGARVTQVLYLRTKTMIRSGTGDPVSWDAWRRMDNLELTQVQVEDDASTVFGVVSGQRLSQAVAEFETPDSVKAWVNFNGSGTPAINTSKNVSSITDNGTGDFTINFTTALANANYAWAGSGRSTTTATNNRCTVSCKSDGTKTTSALQILVTSGEGATVAIDSTDISVAVFL